MASSNTGGQSTAGRLSIVDDQNADLDARISALRAIEEEVGDSDDLIKKVIGILEDDGKPGELRMAALEILEFIDISSALFVTYRPQFMAALRSALDDKDRHLRDSAIERLALEKDEYVQRRLLEGIQGQAKPLVGTTRAIQYLGYDIHAEHYPILQEIVQNPPSQAARMEAIRLLASDASSVQLLGEILRNKGERSEVRQISAASLHAIAPEEFENHAKQIVLDDDEDDDLRATVLTALEQFASPESVRQDPRLNEQVQRLNTSSSSRHLKKATKKFIAKHIS